jgi:hypothetical protein
VQLVARDATAPPPSTAKQNPKVVLPQLTFSLYVGTAELHLASV